MGLFVSGFPTHVAGLKFEYIWTYPTDSKYVGQLRSPNLQPKVSRTFRESMEMLRMLLSNDPYKNQPLRINFLHLDLFEFYKKQFIETGCEVCYCPQFLTEKGYEVPGDQVYQSEKRLQQCCPLCKKQVSQTYCQCSKCGSTFCMLCLAREIAGQKQQLMPVEGVCPQCEQEIKWRDVLLKQQQNLIQERNKLLESAKDENELDLDFQSSSGTEDDGLQQENKQAEQKEQEKPPTPRYEPQLYVPQQQQQKQMLQKQQKQTKSKDEIIDLD